MENPTHLCYNICPLGGPICSLCNYPIPFTNGDYVKAIGRHEQQNSNHDVRSSLSDRKKFVNIFNEYVNNFAANIVNELPNQDTARSIIVQECKGLILFPYCDHKNCNKPVFDKEKHKSKQHITNCQTTVNGYTSKFWTKRHPKVLPQLFSVMNLDNFCLPLRTVLDNKLRQPRAEPMCNLFNLIREKEREINELNTDAEIIVQSEHEANSWVRRVGWDWHLKGLHIGSLLKFNATIQDSEISLKKFIMVFDHLVISSYEILQTKTNPAGTVRWTMNNNRRYTNVIDSKTKPFTMIRDETMKKYLGVMHTFISVLHRIAISTQQTDEQQCVVKIPKFFWYGHQERLIFSFLRDLERFTFENFQDGSIDHTCTMKCLDVIIGLFNHIIRSDPYHSVVLSVLSVMGVKSDGTFELPVKTKQNFAAIFKILKLLVFRKSYEEDIITNGSDIRQSDILAILKGNVSQFMTYESNSTVSWMYNVFNYATELGNNEFSFPKISWLDDSDTLYCDDVQLRLSDLKNTIIPNVITELKSMMQNLLLVNDDSWEVSPVIPDVIFDATMCETRNYSFLKHQGNQEWMKDGKLYIYNNMCRNYRHAWLENLSANESVNARTHNDYEMQRNNFLKLLLFVIHITSGQPGRGTEVVDVRYAN